jgi:hypothetical protein
MKFSETINRVIALATAIRDYWDAELPKRHLHYPLISPGEDSGPPPPEEKQLSDFLASLPEDAIYQLALLMYLGQGAFGTEDLSRQYEKVRARFANPQQAASQMLGKAALADYLIDGMEELAKSGIGVDDPTFTFAHSGS